MNIDDLQRPLKVDEIEFRVQSINNGGYATILAYKDARTDINRLNSVCGRLGWKREHSRDNQNCTVSVYDADHGHWVGKEDTGTESNTEAKKGLASDSFKRACFNWGIGIELYDFPVISIKLLGDKNKPDKWNDEIDYTAKPKPKATWNLKIKEWAWYLDSDESGRVKRLRARDNNGQPRFDYKILITEKTK